MEEETIRRIAREEGVNEKIFVPFFMQRFPLEEMETYVYDWANRFKYLDPKVFMDRQSQAIYDDVVANINENIVLGVEEQ